METPTMRHREAESQAPPRPSPTHARPGPATVPVDHAAAVDEWLRLIQEKGVEWRSDDGPDADHVVRPEPAQEVR